MSNLKLIKRWLLLGIYMQILSFYIKVKCDNNSAPFDFATPLMGYEDDTYEGDEDEDYADFQEIPYSAAKYNCKNPICNFTIDDATYRNFIVALNLKSRVRGRIDRSHCFDGGWEDCNKMHSLSVCHHALYYKVCSCQSNTQAICEVTNFSNGLNTSVSASILLHELKLETNGSNVWQVVNSTLFFNIKAQSRKCNRLFELTSTMCNNEDVYSEVDKYGNVWTAFKGLTLKRELGCPPGTKRRKANVTHQCNGDGRFNPSGPDYTECDIKCENADLLILPPELSPCRICGTVYDDIHYAAHYNSWALATKLCPDNTAFSVSKWFCNANGSFIGEPDFTECKDIDFKKIKFESDPPQVNSDLAADQIINSDIPISDVAKNVSNVSNDFVESKNHTQEVYHRFFSGYFTHFSQAIKNVSRWYEMDDPTRLNTGKLFLETAIKLAYNGNNIIDQEATNLTFGDLEKDGAEISIIQATNITKAEHRCPWNNSRVNCSFAITDGIEESSNATVVALLLNKEVAGALLSARSSNNVTVNSAILQISVGKLYSNSTEVHEHHIKVTVHYKKDAEAKEPTDSVIFRKLHEGEQPSLVLNSEKCGQLDKKSSQWRSSDWTLHIFDDDSIQCTYDNTASGAHLGLLMTIHQYEPDGILETLSLICCVLSLTALSLVIIALMSLREIRSKQKTFSIINLCICLGFAHFMVLTVLDKKFYNISKEACEIYAGILHFLFASAFCWMSLDGIVLYLSNRYLLRYRDVSKGLSFSLCYGFAGAVVSITVAIGRSEAYGRDELCWLTKSYAWFFNAPVMLVCLVNLVILTITVRKSRLLAINQRRHWSDRMRVMGVGTFMLASVLGVPWIFGALSFEWYYSRFFAYLFVILNGLQGVFIFISRCVLNEDVKKCILKKYINYMKPTKV